MNWRLWLRTARQVWRDQELWTLLSCAARDRRRRRAQCATHECALREYLAWAWDQRNEMARRRGELLARLAHRPLVSVVVPAGSRGVRAALRRQSYDRFQVLSGAGARKAADAVNAAAGEWVLVLGPGDRPAPDLLLEAVAAADAAPGADLVYWDEDRLTRVGKIRHDPWLKPDWSPDLMLSVDALGPSLARRQLAVDAVAAGADLRRGHSWDFALRLAERARRVVHVPRVLLHRPTGRPRRAGDAAAVARHLARQGVAGASAAVQPDGLMRAVWPASGRLVSIIIPTRDKADVLSTCLDSIFARTDYPNYEIVLVDNGSREEATLRLYDRLRGNPRVRLVAFDEPFNYSRANNVGARHARGELLLFLNNDTEALDGGWLTELVRWAERPEVGVVGAQLLFPDGTIQHAGVILGLGGIGDHIWRGEVPHRRDVFGSSDWYRNYLAVTGACQMMRRAVFEELGGFDEAYALVFSDVEICLHAHRRGYRNVCTPFARLLHHEGKTRSNNSPLADCLRAAELMNEWIARGDPYFHPLLSWIERNPLLLADSEPGRLERLSITLDQMRASHARAA